ncbi:hypothetical protein ABZ783_01560 [Micromonospora sp. NPDC047738]|uniref:hypothetical protein n=1 Tax=Micromonospora sp. NPDC047738 TaxID=3155741 RepID=UPI0033C553A9
MANRRKKHTRFFLTPEDEVTIAARVAERFPAVRLVDDWRWEDVESPPVRRSPLDCGPMIGIWNSELADTLTGVRRQNGKIDAPDISAKILWYRCDRVGDALEAGHWAVVYDPSDKAVAEFVRALWRVLEGATTNKLMRVSGDLRGEDGSERRFRAGEAAYRMAAHGEISLVANQLVLAPEVG